MEFNPSFQRVVTNLGKLLGVRKKISVPAPADDLRDATVAALEEAVARNPVHSVQLGSTGPLHVWAQDLEHGFTVTVEAVDESILQGNVVVLQLTVDLDGVHLFNAPYGPGQEFDIGEMGEALKIACDLVRNWRLYPS